jgi:predicted Ser/Thr protein kinase
MYDAATAFLDDPHPAVRQEAITAAVVLVRVPELAVHRQHIAAAAQAFLDACTDPVRRRWANEAFQELRPTYVADESAQTQPEPDRTH